MDSNIIGLLISFPFLAVVIALGIALRKIFSISSESMRKFIHIGVSNWWFIALSCFTTLGYALVGPILFIILNSLFTFLGWGVAIGLNDRKRNYGLIYFPITLVVLVALQHSDLIAPLSATVGVLVMGYGDGLAALIGTKWGKREIPFNVSKKSYLGTAVMFVVSLAITLGTLAFFTALSPMKIVLVSLFIALVSAGVELITPLGLDNITVPLIVMILVEVLV
jgi:phytol kinase